MPQGSSVFTKDNVMEYLKKYNKDYVNHQAWRDTFSGINFEKDSAINNIKTDYSEVMGQAYAASKMAGNEIAKSNLLMGNKSAAIEANELALDKAYDAYISKMGGDIGAIENQTSKTLSSLAGQYSGQIESQYNAWEKDAERYVKYADAHMNYLQSLWDRYQNGEIDGEFFKDKNWSKYLTGVYDEEGKPVYIDEGGEQAMALKDASELRKMMFDSDGNLTAAGVDFFDQLEHDEALRDFSFGDYLIDNDKELYDWAMSYNPYSDSTNAQGDQIYDAAFREMMGQISTDEGYSFIERGFGMSPGQIEQYFQGAKKAQEELIVAIDSLDKDKVDAAADDLGKEMETVLDELGIKDDFLASLNKGDLAAYEISSVSDFVKDVANLYIENPSATFSNKFKGAIIGSGAGVVGSVIGAVIGSSIDRKNKDEVADKNKPSSEKMKKAYDTFLADALTYAQFKNNENKENFKQQETINGGTITDYNPYVSQHKGFYNYRLKDGSVFTFLSSAKSDGVELTKHSGVRDKENDNFAVTYDGKKYKLQVGNQKLEGKVLEQANEYVRQSSGRMLEEGDTFMYNNRLWVVTKDGTARSIKNPFLGEDYEELISKIRSPRDYDNLEIFDSYNKIKGRK